MVYQKWVTLKVQVHHFILQQWFLLQFSYGDLRFDFNLRVCITVKLICFIWSSFYFVHCIKLFRFFCFFFGLCVAARWVLFVFEFICGVLRTLIILWTFDCILFEQIGWDSVMRMSIDLRDLFLYEAFLYYNPLLLVVSWESTLFWSLLDLFFCFLIICLALWPFEYFRRWWFGCGEWTYGCSLKEVLIMPKSLISTITTLLIERCGRYLSLIIYLYFIFIIFFDMKKIDIITVDTLLYFCIVLS